MNTLPVRAQNIKQWTDQDPVLSHVCKSLLTGWQKSTDTQMQPYWKRREELNVADSCILWGHGVVVPPPE